MDKAEWRTEVWMDKARGHLVLASYWSHLKKYVVIIGDRYWMSAFKRYPNARREHVKIGDFCAPVPKAGSQS